MWSYRPLNLSELVDPATIRHLLGFGAAGELRSALALIEPDGEGGLRRLDPGRDYPHAGGCAFCEYLRRGRRVGGLAFEGGDRECARSEARLARRVLDAAERKIRGGRCHMGLHDFAAPVIVAGRVVAVVVAGQVVLDDDQRHRVVKNVGKLGKLTRGEVRSLEASGEKVEAAVSVADETARQELLQKVAGIERVSTRLEAGLGMITRALATLAERQIRSARQEHETRLLEEAITAPSPHLSSRGGRLECEPWARGVLEKLCGELALESITLFGPPGGTPPAPRAPLEAVVHCAAEGTEGEGGVAGITLDVSKLPAIPFDERGVSSSPDLVSGLIGALGTSSQQPERGKDLLTKSVLVTRVAPVGGLEAVVVFGPPADGCPADSAGLELLGRLAERVATRYLLLRSERERRAAVRRIEKLQPPKPRPPATPVRARRFDLRKLIDQCVTTVGGELPPGSVEFDGKGLPERLMCEADRERLREAFCAVLRCGGRLARSAQSGAPARVLLGTRRDRRSRSRVQLVVDLLGDFLDGAGRRRLLRAPLPSNGVPARGAPRGEPAPEAKRRDEAPSTPSTPPAPSAAPEPPAAAARENGAAPSDGNGATRRRAAAPPRTLRDVDRCLSSHGGRLAIECFRTRPSEADPSRWLGRTVFTLSFQRAPRREESPGSGAARTSRARAGRGRSSPRRSSPGAGTPAS